MKNEILNIFEPTEQIRSWKRTKKENNTSLYIFLSVIVLYFLFGYCQSVFGTIRYVAEAEEENFYTMQASITAYSELDSCHNKNCEMASTKRAYVGAIACPREISLETKVIVKGTTYTCEDRTAKWVEEKYPNTFDIFFGYGEEAHIKALEFGRQNLLVKILNK